MKVVVQSRQSLLDIALQECGAFEAVIALARRNDISITDDLVAGQTVEVLTEDVVNKRVVEYYRANGINPATAITEDIPFGGIGYMGIEIDFVVS